MAYTFTRTGAQIEEIHNTVEDPKSNTQFSDDIRTIAGEYRGLWPDTGGSANKGDTYQTQVSGTGTGQYFTALQDTTVDPVGDDVNWREEISTVSFSKYTDIVYKASGGNSAVENMVSGRPISMSIGQKCQCENGSIFERISNTNNDITDFMAVSSVYVQDFGAKIGEECFSSLKACSDATSGGGVIMYGRSGDEFFTSDGEIPVYSNQRHIFNGSKLSRPKQSEQNKYAIFKDEAGVDNVIFKGGFLRGNSDESVGSVNPESACIHLKHATNIALYEMDCQGGASGLQIYGCDDVRIYDSELILNKLTGISGISNRVKVKRSKVKSNGFDSAGFTHEIYMTNSSSCEVTGSEVGNNVDGSFSLYVKNEKSEDTYPGFTSCSGWKVSSNDFSGDMGVFFTNASSEGEPQADQTPHIGHKITNNSLAQGAGIRIASPQSCIVSQNTGDGNSSITLTDSSTFPGYIPSCITQDNVVGQLSIGVISSADTSSWKENALFNGNTLLTTGEAIVRTPNFGGATYGRFDGVYTPNTSIIFGDNVNSDHNNGNIIFVGGGDYPSLVVSPVGATINGSPYTPTVKGKGLGVQVFGTVNAATINDTDSVPDGSILEFGMQQNGSGSNRAITFDANYRLTDAWEVNKDINEPGQFFFISFIRRGGVWHQLYECGWT